MIAGIDISHWQNEIDWQEVARSGVGFAYIQATEFAQRSTVLNISPRLTANIRQAGMNGLHWGACHTFALHIDPLIQAESFLEAVGASDSLPPAVKLEEGAGMKAERLNYKLRRFLEEIERASGRRALIHTTRAFWGTHMCAEQQTLADWARDYPLWIAQAGDMWPGPLYPWAGWDFWSHSDSARLPGIRTSVSMVWFNGSAEELGLSFTLNPKAAFSSYEGEEEDLSSAGEEAAEKMMGAYYPDEVGGSQHRGDFQEKMGGAEFSELEYEFQLGAGEGGSQAKDGTWVDAYLFQH